MKIYVAVPPAGCPTAEERLECFMAGLTKHGHERGTGLQLADFAIVNTGWMPNYPEKNIALKRVQAAGKPYVNIGNGFFDKDNFHAVSWNGGVKGQGDFCATSSPTDRWERHGWRIKPWRRETAYGHVLLCGQVPDDPSVGQIDDLYHYHWLRLMVKRIIYLSGQPRPIVFRPHPLTASAAPYLAGTQRSANEDFKADLRHAHVVVTYNSTASALAVLEGIPIVVDGKHSVAEPVAEISLQGGLHGPTLHDRREQWAANLAYSQWTLAEMCRGECWEHLKKGYERL